MEKSFFEYMMGYITWKTYRGILARDMAREFYLHPEEEVEKIESEEQFMHYLNAHRACDDCMEVARRCWKSYRKAMEKT